MHKYQVTVEDQTHTITVLERKGSVVVFELRGKTHRIDVKPMLERVASGPATMVIPASAPSSAPSQSGEGVTAPMPGLIVSIKVKTGDTVTLGQAVIVMEAMKMENNIASNRAGVVQEILVKEGQEVKNGELLIKIG